MINRRIDRIAWRGSGEHVGDQAFIPTPDLVIHGPIVIRAPMPVQHVTPTLGVPVPLDLLPQRRDARTQIFFDPRFVAEIFPCTQQPHAQVRGFHQISAVILAIERNRRSGSPMQEVRKRAVIDRRGTEGIEYPSQSFQRRVARDPAAFHRHDDGHDAEARTADRGLVLGRRLMSRAAIECKAAPGMRALPEKIECPALHALQQLVIGQPRQRGRARRAVWTALFKSHSISQWFPQSN